MAVLRLPTTAATFTALFTSSFSKQGITFQTHRNRSYHILQLNKNHRNNIMSAQSSSTPSASTSASASTIANIRKAKQNLRKQIRSKLKCLTEEEIKTQSQIVWDELYKLPQYKSASNVGLFLSMPNGEIRTDDPCQQVLKDGKDLYVPRVGLDFEQCDMDLIKVPKSIIHDDDDDCFHKDWPRNKWGIPEAPRDVDYELAQPGKLDLLIVPGLGFDKLGGRLGQGKGYYDRFITKMNTGSNTSNDNSTCSGPFLIAVGLEPSFVEGEEIPTNDYDRTMDMIILPQVGVLKINNDGK